MSETMTLEDLAPLKGDTATPQARVYEKKVDAQGRAYATGKRKDAVARVWVKRGPGKITVNGKDHVAYFARPVLADDPECSRSSPPSARASSTSSAP